MSKKTSDYERERLELKRRWLTIKFRIVKTISHAI